MDTPSFRNLDVDGVRIAYWTLGDGPPLVITPESMFSDTQAEWDFPPSRAYYQALAQRWTVVRYDQRGVGRSERQPPDAVDTSGTARRPRLRAGAPLLPF